MVPWGLLTGVRFFYKYVLMEETNLSRLSDLTGHSCKRRLKEDSLILAKPLPVTVVVPELSLITGFRVITRPRASI